MRNFLYLLKIVFRIPGFWLSAARGMIECVRSQPLCSDPRPGQAVIHHFLLNFDVLGTHMSDVLMYEYSVRGAQASNHRCRRDTDKYTADAYVGAQGISGRISKQSWSVCSRTQSGVTADTKTHRHRNGPSSERRIPIGQKARLRDHRLPLQPLEYTLIQSTQQRPLFYSQ